MQRKKREDSRNKGFVTILITFVAVLLTIFTLGGLFAYEVNLLRQTAEKIEVEDFRVEDIRIERKEDSDTWTELEADIIGRITNRDDSDLKIEKLEYYAGINVVNGDSVEFSSGEVKDIVISGEDTTTIEIEAENDDEESLDKIRDYITNERGEMIVSLNIDVPIYQAVLDARMISISTDDIPFLPDFDWIFEFDPLVEHYEVEWDKSTLEEGVWWDYYLKIPYEIETNRNEPPFPSGSARLKTRMISEDKNITSTYRTNWIGYGDDKEGNLVFGLQENEIEKLLIENQTLEFISDWEGYWQEEEISAQIDAHSTNAENLLGEYDLTD